MPGGERDDLRLSVFVSGSRITMRPVAPPRTAAWNKLSS